MKLFICEKPSQAADIAKHVGANAQSGNGCRTGPGVTVTWCIGHLLEQSPRALQAGAGVWSLDHLPVLPAQWHMDVKASPKANTPWCPSC